MEISSSKQKILDVSLELFSIYGYEATSVGQIADAVGIKKASLYSHFQSKQEIFDTLLEEMARHYETYSLLAQTDWNNADQDHSRAMSVDDAVQKVKEQISFLIHDPYISRTRKFLTIEQFRNPEIAAIQMKRAYTDVLNYHKGMIAYLIQNGILRDGDVEIMTLQYFSPISMQLYRVDREPECEEDAMDIIERHIRQFNKMYRK